MSYLVFGDIEVLKSVMLSPMGFAAWIGLWVTSINLIPIGQLDGGHIAYSYFGKKWNTWSKVFFVAMIALGFLWMGWLFWALMIFIVVTLRHPRTVDEYLPLSPKRKVLFWIAVLIFVITFIPVPFK
jgi:membrane-associated protease RseP (regulator of RpoE activity)